MNKLLSLIVIIAALVAVAECKPSEERKLVGGVQALEGDDLNEAKEKLQLYLGRLYESEEGPHYKLGQIHKATKQIVSGSLYKIHADLIDKEEKTKECHVEIWSQPWLENGIEVKFKCDKEEELVKNLSA